jgi:hypothetical protein
MSAKYLGGQRLYSDCLALGAAPIKTLDVNLWSLPKSLRDDVLARLSIAAPENSGPTFQGAILV